MPAPLATQLIDEHLVDGTLAPGASIRIRIDQTLTQDATGTLVMLALEALGLDRAQTELSAQYVDHNLVQADHRNPDDHRFLQSACRRFGIWYARPGTGVSHPVHAQRFGRPGATLLGSDSHTCAAGALGMLAMGAGGLDVALAIAGEPYAMAMPEIWGIELTGALPDWVSAKDVILEMLRRHGVSGGLGRIVEYHGPGVAGLSVWDRHVIANMGAELGATTTVFPSDDTTRAFLEQHGRGDAFVPRAADDSATYDLTDHIDLSALEPLIARPSSPGDVVPVREVSGRTIQQAYLGSSANPGYRDFAVPAKMVEGRTIAPGVSFDVNPTSRDVLLALTVSGNLAHLVAAGARLHQTGCNGCIGMGQAPATAQNSIRTVPRNFPGRSGTADDAVWLASPETATASALAGAITDPRTLAGLPPRVTEPAVRAAEPGLTPPSPEPDATLIKGPNIGTMPELSPLPDELRVPVALVVGDDLSTDGILPAGAEVLPLRSNIPRIARFSFRDVDPDYVARAEGEEGGHCIVAGDNYGQGSSREHAALAPRFLGLRMVLARSFARIHRQNLVNYGVVPLSIGDDVELRNGDVVEVDDLRGQLQGSRQVQLRVADRGVSFVAGHDLSDRDLEAVLAGGVINLHRAI